MRTNCTLILVPIVALCVSPPLDAQVTSFLAKHCVQCHGPEKQRGKLTLHDMNEKLSPDARADLWKRIFERVRNGEMPPPKSKQPTPEERRVLLVTLEQSLRELGITTVSGKWLNPSRGNWVDHQLLFSGKAKNANATRGRLWRLTGKSYEEFIHSLSVRYRLGFRTYGSSRIRSPWSLSPQSGFRDYATQHRIGEPEIEHHLRNARRVAKAILTKLNKNSGIPDFKALVRAGNSFTSEQVQAASDAAVEGILGRKPTEREAKRYVGFLKKNMEQLDTKDALEQLLIAVLFHPELTYRIELPPEGAKRAMLPPRELARSLSYALTDHRPDKKLMKALESGRLRTREQIHAHVTRLLNEPQSRTPRILRFFQEYLGYTTAVDVFKDPATLKEAGLRAKGGWQPDIFVSDTDRTILWILAQDKNVLRELLTTTKTFVATGDSREAQRVKKNPTRPFDSAAQTAVDIYELGITRKDWSDERPFEMPEKHRRGILTHPSWLIAHSTNFENHAIARGHWVRERLLGGRIPEVPVTVDVTLPEEPQSTLRHRMRVTRKEYCWTCHQQMDPLGLPFEQYDHFGRYRTTELKKPVDATGSIHQSGEASLDGDIKDPIAMLEKLARSKHVEQVFVRHAFRYFLGRNETLTDGPTLIAAHHAYTRNNGSMKALITSLLTSDAFLYRTIEAKAEPGKRSKP